MNASGANQTLPWQVWLDVLSAVLPPRGMLVIGAGSGTGPWVQWLRSRQMKPVWLVEGDEAQYQLLQRQLPLDLGWSPRRDVVVGKTGETIFYRASNPQESGLVAPESLHSLWPHLSTEEARSVQSDVTLDSLMQDAASPVNWLLLDCLPSAELLQGGEDLLERVDVALIRVVRKEGRASDSAVFDDAADALLQAKGLFHIQSWPERHPAIAHALYVRDSGRLQARLAQTSEMAGKHERHANELATALEATLRRADELDEAQRAAVERSRLQMENSEAELHAIREAWQQERQAVQQAHEQEIAAVRKENEELSRHLDELTRTSHSLVEELNEAKRSEENARQDARAKHAQWEAALADREAAWRQERGGIEEGLKQASLMTTSKLEALMSEVARLSEAIEARSRVETPAPRDQLGAAAPMPCLFSIETRLDLADTVPLALNTSRPDWIRVTAEGADFDSEGGAPLYVVSNEDGDFNKPPMRPQLPVEAGATYRLSGRIAYESDNKPQIWIFQYDETRKLDAHSLSVDAAGRFRIGFSTLSATKSIAIGLRLAGKGRLVFSETFMRLHEEPAGDSLRLFKTELQAIEQGRRRDIENAVRQIESVVRLQSYLGPDILAPELHGWPISPDLAVLLIHLVEEHAYDAVIEFGSGSSTLVLAKALERVARRAQRQPAPLLSFDHLEQYAERSRRLLARAGLMQHTRIVLAPLATWQGNNEGDVFSYYDCDQALAQLKSELPSRPQRILVVVDGPPAGTGRLARLPAMPKVLQAFGRDCRIHFLIDDYIRGDEQEMLSKWEAELSKEKTPFRRTEFNKLEKKACLLELFLSADTEKSQ